MTILQGQFDDMQREIGRYLGFSRTPADWTPHQIADVADVIKSGYRLFLNPPAIHGEQSAHQWSFARPVSTMTLTTGEIDYPMEEDFGGLVDDTIHFIQAEYHWIPITHINEAEMRSFRQTDWTFGSWYPRYVSFIWDKEATQAQEQRMIAQFWPPPDANHQVTFRYYLRATPLSATNPYPIGGPQHYEAVLLAALAVAEERIDDARGPKWERFLERLASSVSLDRRMLPANLGYNGERESSGGRGGSFNHYGQNSLTEYRKYPLP